MNKLTNEEKQSLCDFYGWRDCQVEDGYVTAIEDEPKNPENAGEWINAGQLATLLDKIEDSGVPADSQADAMAELNEQKNDSAEPTNHVTVNFVEDDGRKWYRLNGTDSGTDWEFKNKEYGVHKDGTILDCEGRPLTEGDLETIAVKSAIARAKKAGAENS